MTDLWVAAKGMQLLPRPGTKDQRQRHFDFVEDPAVDFEARPILKKKGVGNVREERMARSR